MKERIKGTFTRKKILHVLKMALFVVAGSIVYNAGIDASSALLQEDVLEHLLLQVVVKEKNKDTKWAKAIVEAYRSKEFKEYLDKNNNGLWYVPSYN